MNRDKREPEYPAELESQIIIRLPEERAKYLRELLKSGDPLKNRLAIQIQSDMRHGEVKLDEWTMHGKIVDLPTIVESLKTIDNKSFYKTADICQMMICKDEPDPTPVEEETSSKNKRKDPFKVDKKFLWPHGVTPPTKNVRKRRFRKTLKKKFVEAPEIEKEVKRLLRADNEADSITWEVIKDDEDQLTNSEPPVPKVKSKSEKKLKKERTAKTAPVPNSSKTETSNVVDIFGGAVSDSDLEEEQHVNVDNIEFVDDSQMSNYDNRNSDGALLELGEMSKALPTEIDPITFQPHGSQSKASHNLTHTKNIIDLKSNPSSEDEGGYPTQETSRDDMTMKIEEVKLELEELKQRRQRTQHEIAGMENLALRQRFQDILHTLNQEIMFKDMEYQGMITLQNSEDI